MANKENILRLVKVLRAAPAEQFDMSTYIRPTKPVEDIKDWMHFAFQSSIPPCGTSCCIAGWAAYLSPEEDRLRAFEDYEFFEVGQEFLGLTYEQAEDLFYDFGLTKTTAIARLRALAKEA